MVGCVVGGMFPARPEAAPHLAQIRVAAALLRGKSGREAFFDKPLDVAAEFFIRQPV